MSGTISGTYTSGVTLTVNPSTIASTTTISGTGASGGGVYGSDEIDWVLTNLGTINQTVVGNYGVSFAGSGTITNAASGIIYGISGAVVVDGADANVANLGSIGASRLEFVSAYGIDLVQGGVVTNGLAGAEPSTAYIQGYKAAINLGGTNDSTLINYGTISGAPGGTGINIVAGTVVNGSAVASLALISGGGDGIIFSGAGTVVNYGAITGNLTTVGEAGVDLLAGGSVTNQLGGTIGGYLGLVTSGLPAAVVNYGNITGNLGGGAGIKILGGGVTNEVGGTISGFFGILATALATVVNAGVIGVNPNGYGVVLNAGGSVTNQSGGTISGVQDAIKISGASGTVTNFGNIYSLDLPYGGDGVYLDAGGVVINGQSGGTVSSAYIEGYSNGIYSKSAATVTNYGTIHGLPGGGGIRLATGTVVNGPSNTTGAIIASGVTGVSITGAGSIKNYGTINGGGNPFDPLYYGVKLGSGYIGNLGVTSLISAYVGIYAQNATVINAGVIESSHGAPGLALVFGGGTNRLILDPGASFVGTVSGGGAVVAEGTLAIGTAYGVGITTLELATGSSAGTVTSLGGTITNFASLVFDSDAQWTVAGDDQAGGLGTLGIYGFTVGDTIDLTGVLANGATYGSGVLTLTSGGVTTGTLNIQGSFSTNSFKVSLDNARTGTDIIVCFAESTKIATSAGSERIEDLNIGDLVRTYFGGPTPVQWIGRRHVDCVRHPDPRSAWPVRVAPDAFGAGCPERVLFLSPNHAVYASGSLIPIRCLINGTSIAQVPVDEITYYHVELAQHDMLWAEGLLAESYLDAGDRSNFFQGGKLMRLFPDFATLSTDIATLWETKGCAPLVIHGQQLEVARTWVKDRGAHAMVRAA